MQWWCAATGVPWEWRWTAYPGVWIFVAAVAFGFTRLQARFGSEEDGRRAGWFFAGLLAIWVAIDWPVGALAAGYLSSVKMVQYLLLSLVAPPLIHAGLPRGLYRALMRSRGAGLVRVISHPLVAISVFVAVMAWTHWAPVVDGLMVSQLGSFFMDTIWIVAGLIFWWPVSAPLPERSWLGDPARIGYLIAATLVNTGVFAYLTFSELPLYSVYELAPPVTGLSTRDDQRLAGLLMKVGGAVILWTAISIVFFRWANREVSPDGGDRVTAAGLVLLLTLGVAGCGAGADAPAAGEDGAAAVAGAENDVGGEVSRALASGEVVVVRAVIGRPVTPGRAALYLRLANGSDAEVAIDRIEVPGVGRVSIHETSMSGGVMSMTPVAELRVGAGESVAMEPGGLHVMLEEAEDDAFGPDALPIRVVLGDGTVIDVEATVVPLTEIEGALGG